MYRRFDGRCCYFITLFLVWDSFGPALRFSVRLQFAAVLLQLDTIFACVSAVFGQLYGVDWNCGVGFGMGAGHHSLTGM